MPISLSFVIPDRSSNTLSTAHKASSLIITNVVGKQNMMTEKLPLTANNFIFFICNIYLISTKCFNIGGDIGNHEEIHLTWLFFIANTIYV